MAARFGPQLKRNPLGSTTLSWRSAAVPFDYAGASAVARAWFEACSVGGAITLNEGSTIARPYGWVFVGKHVLDLSITGMPYLVFDRVTGEVTVFGSGTPLEYALAQYEASIPSDRLQMTPELPPNGQRSYNTGLTIIEADQPVRPKDLPRVMRGIWGNWSDPR